MMKTKKIKSAFNKNLIRLRKERGLTQEELARLSGLTTRMIIYYESEAGNPPVDKIKNLAEALKVSIEELLLDSEEKKGKIEPFKSELLEINTKTLKRIKQILELSPEDRHVVYSLVDSLLDKKKSKKNQDSKK
jgi:transcriptional regulator with XRE-family HTH domain